MDDVTDIIFCVRGLFSVLVTVVGGTNIMVYYGTNSLVCLIYIVWHIVSIDRNVLTRIMINIEFGDA